MLKIEHLTKTYGGKPAVQKHPDSGLPYHSDEIVRDLHPLPF